MWLVKDEFNKSSYQQYDFWTGPREFYLFQEQHHSFHVYSYDQPKVRYLNKFNWKHKN